MSALVTTRGKAIESESVKTLLNVTGDTGLAPHVFGIVFAWSIHDLLAVLSPALMQKSIMLSGVLAFSYLVVSLIWISLTLKNRFSLLRWQSRLTANRQVLLEGEDEEQLQATLTDTVRALRGKELTTIVLLVVLTTVSLYNNSIPGTTFPIGLLIVFTAIIFVEHGRILVRQLYHLMIGRPVYQQELLDLDQIPQPEESMTFSERVRRALDHKLAWILTFIIIATNLLSWALTLLGIFGRGNP